MRSQVFTVDENLAIIERQKTRDFWPDGLTMHESILFGYTYKIDGKPISITRSLDLLLGHFQRIADEDGVRIEKSEDGSAFVIGDPKTSWHFNSRLECLCYYIRQKQRERMENPTIQDLARRVSALEARSWRRK